MAQRTGSHKERHNKLQELQQTYQVKLAALCGNHETKHSFLDTQSNILYYILSTLIRKEENCQQRERKTDT